MKVKINWGTGLVIGMVCFIVFILFLVIKMSINKEYKHDLVTPEYYAKEMVYQKEIDAEKNTYSLKEPITGEKTPKGWLIHFPKNLDASKIKGTVFLYRPSNQKLDFDFPIVLSGSNLLVPDNKLIGGRWNITVSWEYDEKPYLYKQQIMY